MTRKKKEKEVVEGDSWKIPKIAHVTVAKNGYVVDLFVDPDEEPSEYICKSLGEVVAILKERMDTPD